MTPESARQTISDLIALVGASDLVDLDISDGDLRLRLHRPRGKAASRRDDESVAAAATAAWPPTPEPGPRVVRSSLVGRFYRAREIDAEPLVRVGDTIAPGQLIGVVEAMSLFSEVESEEGGRIARVLVESGDRVEYGQPLLEFE
ncbi:MAG: acetyl-CoA carboxylase biotin carboxyl carrier protein [Chloroflexota bacterium]